METITNWTAKRAGGRITIYGVKSDGRPLRVVGVDKIEAGSPHPVATDKDGTQYLLA